MKKLFLAVIAVFSMTCAFAQNNKPKLSIGPDAGIPIGNANDYYAALVGGSLKLELPVNASAFHVTITSGYSRLIGKRYSSVFPGYVYNSFDSRSNPRVPGVSLIPVKLGTKYYFNNGMYVESEYGTSIQVGEDVNRPFAFVYAPGFGVSAPAGGSNAVDVGIRYEGRVRGNGSLNQFALRIAYKFGL